MAAKVLVPRELVANFRGRLSMLKIAPSLSGSGRRIYEREATTDLSISAVSAAVPPD
jgi:hypothetical protein